MDGTSKLLLGRCDSLLFLLCRIAYGNEKRFALLGSAMLGPIPYGLKRELEGLSVFGVGIMSERLVELSYDNEVSIYAI